MKTDKHAVKSGHIFSQSTENCVYCGVSAEDDCIENKPCPNKPKKQYTKFALLSWRIGGNQLYRIKSNKPITLHRVTRYFGKYRADWEHDSLELMDDTIEEIKL